MNPERKSNLTEPEALYDEIVYMDDLGEENAEPLKAKLLDAELSNPARVVERSDSFEVPNKKPLDDPKNDAGIDDGFLTEGPASTDKPVTYPDGDVVQPHFPRVSQDTVVYPMSPLDVNFQNIIPDVNVYQHKKTLAQGMMDLALLSANANQFRYVLQSNGRHPYFYPSLAMIGASLFLQVAIGIGLIWNSRYNVKDDDQMCKADRANNWTVIGIFLVTILNVFISSFGVVDQAAPVV